MDRSLYVAWGAAARILESQTITANNLANVSTTGFKAELESATSAQVRGGTYPSLFHTVMRPSGWDDSPGPLQTTGNPLDLALHPGRWLAVQTPDGGTAYTRDGALRISADGLLTTNTGLLVLGDNGPITVPASAAVEIGTDGTVSVLPPGEGAGSVAVLGRLRIVEATRGQLARGEDGLMRARRGVDLPAAPGEVLTSGALEGSNVNVAQALVRMIELARQFELQVKLMKTMDENERQAASLSRLG